MSGFWTRFNQLFMPLPCISVTSRTLRPDDLFYRHPERIGLTRAANWVNTSMVNEGQINPEYLINFNAGDHLLPGAGSTWSPG